MADLRNGTSACPYCNAVSDTSKMRVLFSANDQNDVRNALNSMDPSEYPERKRRTADPDPLSTLVYVYEHTTGTEEKLTVLAEGLTRIKGHFTEEDVEELFPGEGEKMIKMMISADIIIEIKFGTFIVP